MNLDGSGWIDIDGDRVEFAPRTMIHVTPESVRQPASGAQGLTYLCVGALASRGRTRPTSSERPTPNRKPNRPEKNYPPDSPEDRMNPQLTHLLVPARHSELVCRAEQAGLVSEARHGRSPSFPRRYVGRVLTARRLRPSRSASVTQHASSNPPHECLS